MPDNLGFYGGKTVLVTGGAGAIGSNLVRALEGSSRVIVLDDLSSGTRWNIEEAEGLTFIQGSIVEDNVLTAAFREKVHTVFHLAALFANQNSIEHPEQDLQVNGLGTLKLLQHAVQRGVERFVFTSSSCVYGELATPAAEERISPVADTPYAATKLLGELYCQFYARQYGLPVAILRCFNSYGPGELPGRYRNVIANFIYKATLKQPLPITGTGEETRDFTYVSDMVDGILLAGASPQAVGEVVNLGSGKETRIIDLAKEINSLLRKDSGVEFVGRRQWDTVSRRCASMEKAERMLGYRPRVGLSEGLRLTAAWFKQNWERIEASARF